MSKRIKTVQVTGYSHFASYLVNDDDSGLSSSDIDECFTWCAANGVRAMDCVDATEEYAFAHPDGCGLPGHCTLYTFIDRS